MEKEINLKNLFSVIRRRILVLVVFTVMATLGGAVYSIFLKTPLYASSARVIIQANTETINTLKVMVNEPAVLEKVAAELNINKSGNALSSQISAESVQGSQILKINVVDTDPVLASKIANTTATVYKQEVANILNFNNVSILPKAKDSKYSAPININHINTIMIAFFVGLVLSIGLIFLLDSLDETIKSERNIEKLLDIPVLGGVSKMNKRNKVDKYSKRETVLLREGAHWPTKIDERPAKLKEKA
ncbi:lipopolysaccharide biosynthesis protein [Bacillus pseudomycoides]|uniref:Lipopolysaccharide biosynthesis protein n=1 Tax=Bacillus pseudomycoides TaxID=64104 RepID=A0AA91VB05_9BACI|nr:MULTISPECIES: Wzz/FepE/Etk N-terminal domain-containing protein [Bacillus]PEB56266.1 lipopolysaccharide biosynthesis protein [Bacillus sp. AFS098217]PED81696.1 lipopolysaccharide biosynthesis protein [Bacillus pseudomycoides]PEU09345.1 lipopolysaccharide biosynthesis protein [Bacillus sp. AFS014408]PEU10624.1 lipopolysaccharide biosynthesis protein [Bacillus sp. AFS019443]PFW64239.1 lipopolysaccharide biosynthesis protein [Bacillus sp. AFS075034]